MQPARANTRATVRASLGVAGVAAAVALALALAGCGESEEPEERVREFVEAYDRADPAACGALVTERYLRRSTGASGERGRALCLEALEALAPAELTLELTPSVQVEGDRAAVEARLEADGEPGGTFDVELRREGGEWLVDRFEPPGGPE